MISRRLVCSTLLRLALLVALGVPFAGTRPLPVQAQANTLSLSVVSARTEPNHPGGPVARGDPISEYKYLINVDNTGDPTQPREPGCSPYTPGYPDTCDWPSIRAVPGAAPIFAQGDQADFASGGVDLPPGKYLISVLAQDYKVGGLHFTVQDAQGPFTLVVELQPDPLPAATMRIKVFEDISSVNGQFDAPAEHGLAGFSAVINDTVGQISADVFGNPLCTQYDPITQEPLPNVILEGCLISDANGDMVIPNLGPLRYDVLVNPPVGEFWLETTTLEGSWSWDTWLQEGGTGLDNEFVVAGEPFPWTVFGFVQPCELGNAADRCPANDAMGSAPGGVSGTLVAASVYLPQQGALPYYGDIWNGFQGSKVTGPITDGWVALSDLQNGDTAIYVGPADADGNYEITGVPDGNYLFTWWDYNLHYILDWIQVTVSDGEVFDMGTPFLTGWFTKVEGFVFIDENKNGVRDEGEPGKSDYLVVLRDRDNSEIDRMSIAAITDHMGYYVFEKAYPMSSWMVLEAYNDRYYTTGITYQVENQPTPTTVLGSGVDVGVLPILGQSARLDWGVHPYEPGTNGGIVGSVFYDTTRNELDPRYQAVEPWAPGIPSLPMYLHAPVPCGTTDADCDAQGEYELAPDGSYAKGTLLNTTSTEIWEHPVECTARDANGNPLRFPEDEELFENPGPADYRCIEAPMMGTQLQTGFATLDGNWGFADGCFGVGGASAEGVCADDSDPVPLPAGDYLVEVGIPLDALGRPMYQVVREEDINIFGGDQFVPAVPPPACAGALHTVDVSGVGVDGVDAVDNPSFADGGGSPFEGQERPLCDVKLVSLDNGKSVAPLFTLFTEVPIPGKWKGYIIDDLSLSTNPKDLAFGEKAGMPNAPIGIYDFANRLVTTIQSDPNGLFEVLLPSTHTMNCPTPTGVCANVYYMLGNDPGQPGALNPDYNPQYRTIGASFEIYPGLLIPSDLAPTQMVPGVLAAGSRFGFPPQCTLDEATPQLFAVDEPFSNTRLGVEGILTIRGLGFGASQGTGKVTLDDTTVLPVVSWSDIQIVVRVPLSTAQGPRQLGITAHNGKSTVNGLTYHVLGRDYSPRVLRVGPGHSYATIQSAIDAAAAARAARIAAGLSPLDRLVVVYPGATSLWNPTGAYFENLVIYDPIKVQGVGPGGVYPASMGLDPVLGSVIDGRGVAGDTAYATQWRTFVQSLAWDGNQAMYEGAVVYILAEDGEFGSTYRLSLDGFTIQGGDQQGFPNNLAPTDPTIKEFAAVQGGGIFANAYARYLQISNNIMQSNGGAYGGAIRLGTPHLPGALNDNQNDFARIVHNRILANGGTNLAGAVGIFSGAADYEVAYNDICGNFSAEYGGGISHYGLSPRGDIHHNRVYFNRSYDEGGGIMIAGELPAAPGTLSSGSGRVDVYSNLIQANLANDDGGGLRFLMAGNSLYPVYNNFIVNNISTHEGGGVSLNDTRGMRFYNNTVMKNITTATAATSLGQPAAAGLSSSRNSDTFQATLPAGTPSFSNPTVFNNIFWDNRAGTFTGGTVSGIGLAGDPNPIVHWDAGVSDGSGMLAPTNCLLQVTTGTVLSASNIVGVDPAVVSTYDTSVQVLPWRGNPRFIDILMVTTDATPNLLGDYHLTSTSPAINAGAASKGGASAPSLDIDDQTRQVVDIGGDEFVGVAAFPTTGILDNFDRADGTTLNGPGLPTWSDWGSDLSRYQILDSAVDVVNGGRLRWLTPFGANQEAYLTFTSAPVPGEIVALMLKLTGGTVFSNQALIQVLYDPGAGTVRIRTKVPGSGFVTQATIAASLGSGDGLGVRARSGGLVTVYQAVSGVWQSIGQRNVTVGGSGWPTAYAAGGGSIGLEFSGAALPIVAGFDNFGGGDVGTAGTPAVAVRVPEANLTLSMVDTEDPVIERNDITYVVTVTNSGPDLARNVVLTDTLPEGAGFVSATASPGACSETGGLLTCNLGDIASGAGAGLELIVNAETVGLVTNVATVTSDSLDPTTADNSGTQDTTVIPAPVSEPQADLALEMGDALDPVTEGAEVSYTVTVINHGPDTSVDVVVSDRLPEGVIYVSAAPSQGSCAEAQGVVTCGLGDLANGSSASAEFVVDGVAAGLITNEALVSASSVDPDLANNSAREDTTIVGAPGHEPQADLSILMQDSLGPVVEGDDITYTVTVTNAGPDSAVNVLLTYSLPEGVRFLSAAASQGTCAAAEGVLTCALGDVPSSGMATVQILVASEVAGLISSGAMVTSDTLDPSFANNEAIQEITVEPGGGSTQDQEIV